MFDRQLDYLDSGIRINQNVSQRNRRSILVFGSTRARSQFEHDERSEDSCFCQLYKARRLHVTRKRIRSAIREGDTAKIFDFRVPSSDSRKYFRVSIDDVFEVENVGEVLRDAANFICMCFLFCELG